MISPDFQHGIWLLNSSHFFEAHEVLEDIWRPMPRKSSERVVMQGLVQIAVALHHQSVGNRTGALSVMRRAARNVSHAAENAFGVRMNLLRPALAEWIAALEKNQTPVTPKIVFVERSK